MRVISAGIVAGSLFLLAAPLSAQEYHYDWLLFADARGAALVHTTSGENESLNFSFACSRGSSNILTRSYQSPASEDEVESTIRLRMSDFEPNEPSDSSAILSVRGKVKKGCDKSCKVYSNKFFSNPQGEYPNTYSEANIAWRKLQSKLIMIGTLPIRGNASVRREVLEINRSFKSKMRVFTRTCALEQK